MKLSNLSLKNLRQRDLTLIILVLTILLAVLWYFYMFTPTRERIVSLDADIVRLTDEVRQGEIAERNLPELEESLVKARQAKADFLAELPTESEVASFIDSLRARSAASGVVLNSINRGGGSAQVVADVRPVGFSLSTTATYGATMQFLSDLQNLKRFTKIQSVNLSKQDDGTTDDPTLGANFDITVFVYTGTAGDSQ